MQGKLAICLITAVFLLTGCSFGIENSQNSDQQSGNIPVDNKFYELGTKLKDDLTLHNNSIYLAMINSEPINLSEWNYMVYYMEGKKTQEEVFQDFVELKTQVAAAKKKDLMPSSEDLSQIMTNTQASITDKTSSIYMLLQGAELTGDEYCEIMKPQWIDKLAGSNWQIYVNDYLINDEQIDLETMDQSDYSKIFYSKAVEELGDLEVSITEEGIRRGLDNNWLNDIQ